MGLVHALLCGCCAVDASLDQTPSKPHIACNLTVYRRRRSTNSGRCAPSLDGSAADHANAARAGSADSSTYLAFGTRRSVRTARSLTSSMVDGACSLLTSPPMSQ